MLTKALKGIQNFYVIKKSADLIRELNKEQTLWKNSYYYTNTGAYDIVMGGQTLGKITLPEEKQAQIKEASELSLKKIANLKREIIIFFKEHEIAISDVIKKHIELKRPPSTQLNLLTESIEFLPDELLKFKSLLMDVVIARNIDNMSGMSPASSTGVLGTSTGNPMNIWTGPATTLGGVGTVNGGTMALNNTVVFTNNARPTQLQIAEQVYRPRP